MNHVLIIHGTDVLKTAQVVAKEWSFVVLNVSHAKLIC